MNRDILLGVSFSLILHSLVLWFGSHIQLRSPTSSPFPATLDLSIMKTSTYHESSKKEGPTRETPRAVASPSPFPAPSRPGFLKMAQIPPRHLASKGLKRIDKTVMASQSIPKAQSSGRLPVPRPIWNARVIPKTMPLTGQPSKGREVSPTTPNQSSKAAKDTPSSPISSLVNRKGDDLKPPAVGDRGIRAATIRDPLGQPLKPQGEKGSGMAREAYGTDHRDARIVEAVPNYLINPKPKYPKLAIRRGYEGTVILLVEVLPDGSVREVKILKSSGRRVLDQSALKTVRKWRFKPGTKGGRPVTMRVKVPVVFRLKRDARG